MAEGITLTFSGVVTNELTGERTHATVTFTSHGGQCALLAVDVESGESTIPYVVESGFPPALLDALFPSNDSARRIVPLDPINLDGSPRNRLIDRWHRRGLEAFTAD